MSREKQLVEQITETLKMTYRPLRLFLFGSRASGTAKDSSDFDFIMIVRESKFSNSDEMSNARNLFFDTHKVAADIFIYTEKEFIQWSKEFNSIPEVALNIGNRDPYLNLEAPDNYFFDFTL